MVFFKIFYGIIMKKYCNIHYYLKKIFLYDWVEVLPIVKKIQVDETKHADVCVIGLFTFNFLALYWKENNLKLSVFSFG